VRVQPRLLWHAIRQEMHEVPGRCEASPPARVCGVVSGRGVGVSGLNTTQTKPTLPHPRAMGCRHPSPRLLCIAGTFKYLSGDVACTECSPGFFCPTDGLTEQTLCPDDQYCTGGTVEPDECIPGGRACVWQW
jgi:hypothetical protein